MKTDLTFENLQEIQNGFSSGELFSNEFGNFLKDKKDDYYFYGYKPYDVPYLEITIIQLEKILETLLRTNRKHSSEDHYFLIRNVIEVLQASIITEQKSVFLYGRLKNYE